MSRRLRRFVQEHPALPDYTGRILMVVVAVMLSYGLVVHFIAQIMAVD